jgi:hypothetical protein
MSETHSSESENPIEVVAPPEILIDSIRKVGTLAASNIQPYKDASISIESMDPELLSPIALYILEGGLEKQQKLIEFFLKNGIDPFRLDSMIKYTFEGETYFMVPPIVEVHQEEDGGTYSIIIDGLHRLTIAREMGRKCNVVIIEGASIPPHALPVRWEDVNLCENVPEFSKKKRWRDLSKVKLPEGMSVDRDDIDPRYLLYRDFSSLGSNGIRK